VSFTPCLIRGRRPGGSGELIRLGHPLLDTYLELVTAHTRPNTVIATAFDLKVFFTVIDKDPVEITVTDVLAFIKAQREPRRGAKVVRIEDGERGLSARTIKRRLATVAGLYEGEFQRTSQLRLTNGLAVVVRRPLRGLPVQALAWTVVQLVLEFPEPLGGVGGEVGSLRDVVAQQAVRVLVGRSLPRGVCLAEVDARPEVGSKLDVAGHLAALSPCQRAAQAGAPTCPRPALHWTCSKVATWPPVSRSSRPFPPRLARQIRPLSPGFRSSWTFGGLMGSDS
jgi:hypothetical protein